MNWFDGTISDAINKAKSVDAVFVVYITDDSSVTETNNEVLQSKEVANCLNSGDFVAIKLHHKAESCNQFVQIYPLVATPCFYFIGKNGVALEIIPGPLTIGDFIPRIEQVLSLHRNKDTSSPPASEGTSAAVSSSELTNNKEALTLEEKLEKTKQLIAEARERKEKESMQSEKLKEVERRKLGQELQKFKEKQHQDEMRKIAEERRKEREEDRIAREKIKQLIAQDRADKKARWERDNSSEVRQRPVNVPESNLAPPKKFDSTRIQFRLPDGSSTVKEFPLNTKLQDVCIFISSSLTNGSTNFKLCTTFPRHDFTEAEYPKSLLELQLVPTAVLLIIPLQSSTGGALVTQSGYRIMSFITAPIYAVFNLIRYILSPFIPGSRSRAGVQNDDLGQENVAKTASPDALTRETDKIPSSSTKSAVKRVGNIHRLTNNDDDDEQNTWNGNSTQQM